MRRLLADRLAKEAAVADRLIEYDKIPREVIITRQKENGFNMWQKQWTNTGKGAVTKISSPCIPRVYHNGDRTWETKVISSQIRIHR